MACPTKNLKPKEIPINIILRQTKASNFYFGEYGTIKCKAFSLDDGDD